MNNAFGRRDVCVRAEQLTFLAPFKRGEGYAACRHETVGVKRCELSDKIMFHVLKIPNPVTKYNSAR
jgi:hypothetical protein